MSIPNSLEESLSIKYDCRHFKGTVPCTFHKQYGVECWGNCEYYDPVPKNVLIIKLGAMGDVIRTTPLLIRIKEEYPKARVFWLTRYKEVLPKEIDWTLDFSIENITWLRSLSFTMGVNLDKDPEACALMEQLNFEKKFGFGLKNGMPAPLNDFAVHKFIAGISDQVSKSNTKHYLEEIFEIMDWQYEGEEYLLPEAVTNSKIDSLTFSGKVIGLNTGCGNRWRTRNWPETYWNHLTKKLLENGYNVLLLGGADEHKHNQTLAEESGALYPGYFSILEFISLMKKCDLVVTAVTMAMHIAIGLKIPIVLFNNIFNPNEFHFFTKSKIVSPEKSCDCYYLAECIHGESCMRDLSVDRVYEAIQSLLDT